MGSITSTTMMLVAQKDGGQREEERAREQQLDDLEGAADRLVEHRAQHNVRHGEQHHGGEENARGRAAGGGDPTTPTLQFQKFFEVFACFSDRLRMLL